MDARLESRDLSSNYTTRNLSEDLIKLKTCLKILIFSSQTVDNISLAHTPLQ